MSKRTGVWGVMVLAALGIATAACSRQEQAAPFPRAAEPVRSAGPAAAVELPRFVDLVKEQGPAVVGISAVRMAEPGGVPRGHPLYEFFDIAMEISEQLRKHGKVTRGRIGIQLQEITYDMAIALGLKEPKGALVAAVQRGGPAHQGGVRPGDVILSLAGRPVESTADLARLIGSAKPGTAVEAQLWRDEKPVKARITVDEQR